MRINRIRVELLFGSRGFFHESHAFSPFPCGAYNRRCRPTPAPAITQLFGFPCDARLTACPEGSFPNGLIEGADGTFYGITVEGALASTRRAQYSRSLRGGVLTVLFNFAEPPDGSLPDGAAPTSLVEGMDGFRHHAPGWRQRGGNRIQE